MSYTARDLIAASLRLLGVLASAESASASEATDGLNSLNDLLDSWSNENLFIPNSVREVFALTVSKQIYTMGPSGDFSTTRPIEIQNVLVQLAGSNPAVEVPLQIVTQDEYAAITVKGLSSQYPVAVYSEGTYPLETLNLWPSPNTGVNLVIYSAKPLANISNLSTTLSLPPGYQRALKYNLAIELAPEYGRQPSEVVVAEAANSRAAIKRKNSKPKFLQVDDAVSARPVAWDWRTGEPR